MTTSTATQAEEVKAEKNPLWQVGQPSTPPPPAQDPRRALKLTATTATVFALLGHTVLGFEQTVLQMLIALATGYSTAIILEWIDARVHGRQPPFLGNGLSGWVNFLAAPHMTSITTSFLIYTGSFNLAMVFTVALAIASKYIFRVRIGGRWRHFFNPSNFGIAVALLLFPWVTAIPYQFTTEMHGALVSVDVLLPLLILVLGSRVNYVHTKRWPLILSWLGSYAVLGIIRAIFQGSPLGSVFMPMTGLAFILFTFYMITDPMTSPSSRKGQIAFGLGIGATYQALMLAHVFFTLFYAVVLVCAVRGLWLFVESLRERGTGLQPLETAPARAA
jgi:enediyne biosynthesis protein E5